VIEPTVRDPDDDHVLACALGAQAALIVTRDRDLLELGAFRDILILAAHEALDLIAAAAR
jgi:predicted nucleic acid-binding protein